MQYVNSSFILTFLISIWDEITLIFKNSRGYQFCRYLADVFKSSFIYRFFAADSRVAAAFQHSLVKRWAEFALNAIPNALSTLAGRIGGVEHSRLLRLFSWLSRFIPQLIGLGILLIFIIPQGRWNNYYSLLLALGALMLYYLGGIKDRGRRLTLEDIGAYPSLFFALLTLSFFWSLTGALSLRFLAFALTCAIITLVFVNSAQKENALLIVLGCVALGLLICSLYGLYQSYVGVMENASYTDLSINAGMPGRIFSFFGNPNIFANLLVMFAPLMLSLVFYAPRLSLKLIFLAAFGAASLALLLTFSRGGWLAFVFALFVLVLLLSPRWAPLLVMAGLAALPFLPATILNRLLTIFNFADSSASARMYIYNAALSLIGGNPVFGVGLGAAPVQYYVKSNGIFHGKFTFVHTHNLFLQIWAEAGVLAMVLYVLMLFYVFRAGLRALKGNISPLLKGALAGCMASLAGSAFFGLTDYPWAHPRVMVLYWFLFALTLTAVKLAKSADKYQPQKGIE